MLALFSSSAAFTVNSLRTSPSTRAPVVSMAGPLEGEFVYGRVAPGVGPAGTTVAYISGSGKDSGDVRMPAWTSMPVETVGKAYERVLDGNAPAPAAAFTGKVVSTSSAGPLEGDFIYGAPVPMGKTIKCVIDGA
eukprot:426051-Prymnesium_polylepis.1